MSQHFFTTMLAGSAVTLQMGWDRPLQEFYLVVFRGDDLPDDHDSQGFLYSNLHDPDAPGSGLDYFLRKLSELGLQPPQAMVDQVRNDGSMNVGNRICHYGSDGSLREAVEVQ